jgi:hypothetical protein
MAVVNVAPAGAFTRCHKNPPEAAAGGSVGIGTGVSLGEGEGSVVVTGEGVGVPDGVSGSPEPVVVGIVVDALPLAISETAPGLAVPLEGTTGLPHAVTSIATTIATTHRSPIRPGLMFPRCVQWC